MKAYFVTATGTDIGKTYVCCRLLDAWRSAGLHVEATKPLMTGFSDGDLFNSDCGQLLIAMGLAPSAESISGICYGRFEPPLAPNVAMRLARDEISHEDILEFTRKRLAVTTDRHLVEGAGGVMSPLTDASLQLDLMTSLGLPILLVTAEYLGSISHTLSAIEVVRGRGLEISRIVVSEPSQIQSSPGAFCSELMRFTDIPCSQIRHAEDASKLSALLDAET